MSLHSHSQRDHKTVIRDGTMTRGDECRDHKTVIRDGTMTRGDERQLIGVYCPDCHGEEIAVVGGHPIRHKPEVAWCLSDRHSVFDDTGRLV